MAGDVLGDVNVRKLRHCRTLPAAELAQGTLCLLEEVRSKQKRGGAYEWTWGAVMVGVYCVVMTTRCAIRTHCITITTNKAAGTVSAKQPTRGNLQRQANQSERRG